jgi:hypothetical protein
MNVSRLSLLGILVIVTAYSVLAVPGDAYAGTERQSRLSDHVSDDVKDRVYGQRYSQSILRGVTLSDVYQFNTDFTTAFGPAYANVWLSYTNFLQCNPPTGRPFSYALCYYSGPDDPTGIPSADNPSLPCTLSPDGTVANCLCYEISTSLVSPKLPYLVDIHAVSDVSEYQKTVETCGHDGRLCPNLNSDSKLSPDRDPDICDAINASQLVPGADMYSVFSPYFMGDYIPLKDLNDGPTTTDCSEHPALYAGCMTAPCYRKDGATDENGNSLVECKCPVFDGPFQIGQPGQSCDANDPVVSATPSGKNAGRVVASAKANHAPQQRNVWSAAYNPNGGPIVRSPCIPDGPGANGCELYDPTKDYRIDPDGALCAKVCDAYASSPQAISNVQVGYSCDATLCTTLGIGQDDNPYFPPPAGNRNKLLAAACNGIDKMDGIKSVIEVEALAECSCCASQVCACDESDVTPETNAAVRELDDRQRDVGIWTQCLLNQTLCGVELAQ